MSFTTLLHSLESELNNIHAPVCKYLNEALTTSQMETISKDLNISLPDELIDLYSWKNGTKWKEDVYLGHLALFPGAMLMPFERAIEAYKVRSGQDQWWKHSMLPIFEFGGDFYLLDLNPTSSNYKRILYYCLNETDFEVIISIYDSIQTCIQTVLECYRTKAYFINAELFVDTVPELERTIAKKLNPNSEFYMLADKN